MVFSSARRAAQDLYVAPLTLVGFGLGAAVAACFVATRPALVAAAALCELWAEPPADVTFHPGQAARFASDAEAAAFLCADCWVRSPRVVARTVSQCGTAHSQRS
jgi:pimeloyl-ACP methyl ester carboxylesterase